MLVLSCFKTSDTFWTASDMSSANVHVRTEDCSIIIHGIRTFQYFNLEANARKANHNSSLSLFANHLMLAYYSNKLSDVAHGIL